MKNFARRIAKIVYAMAWNRKRLADIFWRITVVLLPWQTRWFQEGPLVQGFHWEMGNVAMYASWIPMLITILLSAFVSEKNVGAPLAGALSLRDRAGTAPTIGVILLALASFFTLSPRATGQWWAQILLLVLFVRALVRLRVPVRSYISWTVISLLPHVLLGLEQFAAQIVWGSKWLGMAPQNPMTPGVSVVGWNGQRVLRAYGGFPHPNIFGGWLAAALPFTVWLARGSSRNAAIGWSALALIYAMALVQTFSRSAWIAAFVGLLAVSIQLFRSSEQARRQTFGWIAILVILCGAAIETTKDFSLVASRFQTDSRLETKSLDERGGSLRDGWNVFVHRPWFGTGPNASLLAPESGPVPTHNVPLLALSEIGLIGIAGLVLLGWHFRNRLRPGDIWLAPTAVLAVLMLFDHYPWSLWSGQVLAAAMIAAIALRDA